MYWGLVMDKFNPYILLVIRWLQNSDLVSKKELKANANAACAAYRTAAAAEAAVDAAYAAYRTAAAVDAAVDVAYAAYEAAYTAYYTSAYTADTNATRHWLAETNSYLSTYFEITKEDRTTYEKQAKYLNVLGVNNE